MSDRTFHAWGPRVLLVGLPALLGLTIALVWGMDWRWLFSAAVAAVVALVLACARDARRRPPPDDDAIADAVDDAFRSWITSLTENTVTNDPEEGHDPLKERP